MASAGVRIEGLSELRQAVRRSVAEMPKATTEGLREAGQFARIVVIGLTVKRTGNLAKGWTAEVFGYRGQLVNRVVYAGVAVHSTGFPGWDRHGSAPRWGPKGIGLASARMEEIISRHLAPVVTFHGWARGR